MIESYLLVICVTLEQEEAIRGLFKLRAWKYKQVGRHKEEFHHLGNVVQTKPTEDGTNTEPQSSGLQVTSHPLKVIEGQTSICDSNERSSRLKSNTEHSQSLKLDCHSSEKKDDTSDSKQDKGDNGKYGNIMTGSECNDQPLKPKSDRKKHLPTAKHDQLSKLDCHSSAITVDTLDDVVKRPNLVNITSASEPKNPALTKKSSEILEGKTDVKTGKIQAEPHKPTAIVSVSEGNNQLSLHKSSKLVKATSDLKDDSNLVESSKAVDIKIAKDVSPQRPDVLENVLESITGNSLKNTLLRRTSLRRKNTVPIQKNEKDESKFNTKKDPTSKDKNRLPLNKHQIRQMNNNNENKKGNSCAIQKYQKTTEILNKEKDRVEIITEKSGKRENCETVSQIELRGKCQSPPIEAKRISKKVNFSEDIEMKTCQSNMKRELNDNKRCRERDKKSNSPESDNKSMSQMDSLSADVKTKVLEIFGNATTDTKGFKEFKCFYCTRIFSKKSHFIKHIQRHTKQEFDCPECGKKFNNHRNMNAHRFKRSGQKKFKCEICNHESDTACLLRIHKKASHPSTLTFMCHLCPKVIRTKSYLNIHLKLTHGIDDGKYECPICGKKSQRPKLFQKHLETHKNPSNDRQCPICEKIFKSKKHLRSHKRVHQERKHICDECGKSFTTITKLAGHKRTHTGIKPFQCLQCDYKSTQAGNLRSHMKVHQRYGENKTESTKSKNKSMHDSSVMNLKPADTVYVQSNDQQEWFSNKVPYQASQTVQMEPTAGYTAQSMLYADQGQGSHHYGDEMSCQGDHHYGDEVRYNGSKDVTVNPDSHTHMSREMYQGEMDGERNQYQGMVYNHMEGYANTYTNSQYYNSLESSSYPGQRDPTVTNTGNTDVMADNTMKQFTGPTTNQAANIHNHYQQQSGQTMQQQDHHHHQQHCLMYPHTGTSDPVKLNQGKHDPSLYGSTQCYTDIGQHPNTTIYTNTNNLDSSMCNNEGQSKSYVTDISKSNFTNPNVRIYLGSESALDSLSYTPYPVNPSAPVPYGENSHPQDFNVNLSQETYTELQQTHFTNLTTTEMS